MIYLFLSLAGGLVILLLCGDSLVRGAVAMAQRHHVPPIVTGLTIVAFGTSAPELVVSVDAAWRGVPGMALGNVVGSNIANILLVLGLPAIIYPITCNAPAIRRNALMMIAATLAFLLICFTGTVSAWHGLGLLVALALFILYSGYYAVTCPKHVISPDEMIAFDGIEELQHSPLKQTLFILIGLIGLPVGAHFTVSGGAGMAQFFGISDAAIGLTLVAIGTSLPELATSLMAALRRQPDVAVGNVIGSNIFNILGILGITALVAPLPVPASFLHFDLWIMLAAALVIVPIILARGAITRLTGILFTLAYGAYLFFAIHADQASIIGVTGSGVTG